MGTEVLLPDTGELLDLSRKSTSEIADSISRLLELRRNIDSFNRTAQMELAERLQFEGKKGVTVDGWRLQMKAPAKEWDLERLHDVLDGFVEDGIISQAKADACIRVTTSVDAREVQPLLDDPRTAPEISLCFEVDPDEHRSVTVKRAAR